MKQADSDCMIKCTGDKSASCGGSPNFVSSYITDSSSKLTYLFDNIARSMTIYIIVPQPT